jgi:histidinol dehydrogenase
MRVYDYASMTAGELHTVLRRSTADIFQPEHMGAVRAIFDRVRTSGDAALVDALKEFDGVSLDAADLRIAPSEFDEAKRSVPAALQRAISASIEAVRRYNERLLQGSSWLEEFAPGVVLGEKSTAIDRVGLYVPCGKGSFPSVLVQIATPAVVAGVPEIAVVLPPMKGHGKAVDPAVLVAADQLGLREIYRVNGPSGVAALAIGTSTIRRVRKIAGPGSPAVTAAQILAQLEGIEVSLLFGPSESLVLADDSADPRLVAADYLNEAEHGHDSAALLVTPSRELVTAVEREVAIQLAALPEWRREFAVSATTKFGGAIVVRDLDEGIAFANEYAPEHMQVAARDPLFVLGKLHNAGEILLGGCQLRHRRAGYPSDGRLRSRELGRDRAQLPQAQLDRLSERGRPCADGRHRPRLGRARGLSPARGQHAHSWPGVRIGHSAREDRGDGRAARLSQPALTARRWRRVERVVRRW